LACSVVKSCFPAHTGTQSTTLPPNTQPATFILKHQGNWPPCVSRTHGSCCSMGDRRCKPAALVHPSWQQLVWLLEVSTNKQAPGLLLPVGLVPPVPAVVPLDYAPGSLGWQSGPRTSDAHRLSSPKQAGVAWLLVAQRQQVGLRALTA
jgi:hypothetical protein